MIKNYLGHVDVIQDVDQGHAHLGQGGVRHIRQQLQRISGPSGKQSLRKSKQDYELVFFHRKIGDTLSDVLRSQILNKSELL